MPDVARQYIPPMRIEFEGIDAAPGLAVDAEFTAGELRWSVANSTDAPLAVDRVHARWRLHANGPVRMLRNGYQSWSSTGGGTIGVDEDLSRTTEVPGAVRAAYHADAGRAAPGELRSELVTALADSSDAYCLGFDGGDRHDGTFRVTTDAIVAEALLGGAVLAPGERRTLHDLRVDACDPVAGLDAWAQWAGTASAARVESPYRVGWCSWYQYFHAVTEADVRANLARAGDWPIDVFQVDDGFQAAIGDWRTVAPTFPSPLDRLAADIDGAGYLAGLWLAPFLAAPDSELARLYPDWIVRRASGRTVVGVVNPPWGGAMHVLDTTHPEVLAHLEQLARDLVAMGWRYLKLDFTYAPSFAGEWHDPTLTPSQRVRAGYDAMRRGAGDDTFLLGCGAPLGPCIGVVDGMRIGPDVAPWWAPPAVHDAYADAAPSTKNAARNTMARSFQHRRLWLNDPDCLMLRTRDTQLDAEQVETWARVVAASGGMALVSDDLALLDTASRRLLEDVIAEGRAVDTTARTSAPPECSDLLEGWTPSCLGALRIDTEAGRVL